MDQTFSEFIRENNKSSEPRNHKIKGSYNTINGLTYYRSIRPKDNDFVLSQCQFLSIIREMNLLMIDRIVLNGSFTLPSGMGKIEINKLKMTSWIDKNGKLRTNRPVDFLSTRKLWYEDEESKLNKTLVRFDNDYTFRLKYKIKGRLYHNSKYFSIQFGRYIKHKIKEAVEKGGYDTYEIKPYKYEQNKIYKSSSSSW